MKTLPVAIAARAGAWTRAAMAWKTRPVSPNHGKALIISEFQSEHWMGDIAVWASGEAEFQSVRLSDNRIINKHYDLTGTADVDRMLDEVTALLTEGRTPPGAVEADL